MSLIILHNNVWHKPNNLIVNTDIITSSLQSNTIQYQQNRKKPFPQKVPLVHEVHFLLEEGSFQ